jgi:hypothetical protein
VGRRPGAAQGADGRQGLDGAAAVHERDARLDREDPVAEVPDVAVERAVRAADDARGHGLAVADEPDEFLEAHGGPLTAR